MPSMRALQRGALAVLLAGTALAGAACGGGSAARTTTTATTTAASAAGAANGAGRAAFATYSACLAKHGVTFRAFRSGRPPAAGGAGAQGTGRPRFAGAKFQKAAAACAALRPSGFGRAGAGPGFAGANGPGGAAFAAYRNCLTLHGVQASALRRPAGAAPTTKLQKAMTACASLRPSRPAPPATTAAPTTTS